MARRSIIHPPSIVAGAIVALTLIAVMAYYFGVGAGAGRHDAAGLADQFIRGLRKPQTWVDILASLIAGLACAGVGMLAGVGLANGRAAKARGDNFEDHCERIDRAIAEAIKADRPLVFDKAQEILTAGDGRTQRFINMACSINCKLDTLRELLDFGEAPPVAIERVAWTPETWDKRIDRVRDCVAELARTWPSEKDAFKTAVGALFDERPKGGGARR